MIPSTYMSINLSTRRVAAGHCRTRVSQSLTRTARFHLFPLDALNQVRHTPPLPLQQAKEQHRNNALGQDAAVATDIISVPVKRHAGLCTREFDHGSGLLV